MKDWRVISTDNYNFPLNFNIVTDFLNWAIIFLKAGFTCSVAHSKSSRSASSLSFRTTFEIDLAEHFAYRTALRFAFRFRFHFHSWGSSSNLLSFFVILFVGFELHFILCGSFLCWFWILNLYLLNFCCNSLLFHHVSHNFAFFCFRNQLTFSVANDFRLSQLGSCVGPWKWDASF